MYDLITDSRLSIVFIFFFWFFQTIISLQLSLFNNRIGAKNNTKLLTYVPTNKFEEILRLFVCKSVLQLVHTIQLVFEIVACM